MLTTKKNCDNISAVGDRYDADPPESLKLEKRTKRDMSGGPSK